MSGAANVLFDHADIETCFFRRWRHASGLPIYSAR
jgi:hypothetical protein